MVYISMIVAQVCKAYLNSEGDYRRGFLTSFFYIILCSWMAYSIINNVSPTQLGESLNSDPLLKLWASFLIGLLSLTGVAWSGPGSWVDCIGIRSPDYTNGRKNAKIISNILANIRDVDQKTSIRNFNPSKKMTDFSNAVEALLKNIEENFDIEPSWASKDLYIIASYLYILSNELRNFGNNYTNFEVACKGGSDFKDFHNALEKLSLYWPDWGFNYLKIR